MALNTYAALQTTIADYLNRSDLTSQIPDFITLAEAKMKRRLRRTDFRTTLTISSEETSLPSDCAVLVSGYLETGSPHQDVPLRIGTPEMVAERRARAGAATGRPTDMCIVARKLVVAPTPDQSYTARIVYLVQLTALSASATSNTILVEAPDAYLYGALAEAEPFLEHDERVVLWKSLFDAAIDELNAFRENEQHTAGLQGVRLPVVFG